MQIVSTELLSELKKLSDDEKILLYRIPLRDTYNYLKTGKIQDFFAKSRLCLETVLFEIYKFAEIKAPQDIIDRIDGIEKCVDASILSYMHSVRIIGNVAVHSIQDFEKIKRIDLENAAENFIKTMAWFGEHFESIDWKRIQTKKTEKIKKEVFDVNQFDFFIEWGIILLPFFIVISLSDVLQLSTRPSHFVGLTFIAVAGFIYFYKYKIYLKVKHEILPPLTGNHNYKPKIWNTTSRINEIPKNIMFSKLEKNSFLIKLANKKIEVSNPETNEMLLSCRISSSGIVDSITININIQRSEGETWLKIQGGLDLTGRKKCSILSDDDSLIGQTRISFVKGLSVFDNAYSLVGDCVFEFNKIIFLSDGIIVANAIPDNPIFPSTYSLYISEDVSKNSILRVFILAAILLRVTIKKRGG